MLKRSRCHRLDLSSLGHSRVIVFVEYREKTGTKSRSTAEIENNISRENTTIEKILT